MSYQFEIQRVKSRFLNPKDHLVIRTQDGRILDHFSGNEKGIKKASFLDSLSFQGKKVVLDGKAYLLKNKSLNSFLIRNGTRLSFDRYSSGIQRAVSRGLRSALRFLPKEGRSPAEMRGEMILKCLHHYCSPSMNGVHFPYDEDPSKFKKNYKDPLKWEHFFINLWNASK